MSRYSENDPSQCCSRKLETSSLRSIIDSRGLFALAICSSPIDVWQPIQSAGGSPEATDAKKAVGKGSRLLKQTRENRSRWACVASSPSDSGRGNFTPTDCTQGALATITTERLRPERPILSIGVCANRPGDPPPT